MPKIKRRIRLDNGCMVPKGSERFRSLDQTGNEAWEVDDIIEEEVKEDGRIWYLVKWKGWSNRFNNWEPPESFVGGIEKIKENIEMEKKLKSPKIIRKNIKKDLLVSSKKLLKKQRKPLKDLMIISPTKFHHKKLHFAKKSRESKMNSQLDDGENYPDNFTKIKLMKCSIQNSNRKSPNKLIPNDVDPNQHIDLNQRVDPHPQLDNSDFYQCTASTKYTPSEQVQDQEAEEPLFSQSNALAAAVGIDEELHELFSPMSPRFQQESNLLSLEDTRNEIQNKRDPYFYHNQDSWEASLVDEAWMENLEGNITVQPNLIMFKVVFRNKLTDTSDIAWLNNEDCLRFAPVAVNQYLLMKFLEYQKNIKGLGCSRR